MAAFEVHTQLLADCHRLGKFPLCHVLLHKNGMVPWFILVPETDVTDLVDLPEALRSRAMAEAAALSEFVKKTLGWPKVNFAAIGNVVPNFTCMSSAEKLGMHVGRRQSGAI